MLDADFVHEKVVGMNKYLSHPQIKKLIQSLYDFQDEKLSSTVFGVKFKNPIGLAAGFDKNGELIDVLPAFGFGFIEIGSVTAHAGEGDPKPRTFRLPKDKAIINHTKLPSKGANKVYETLKERKFEIPVGINIAKTPNPDMSFEAGILDVCYSFARLHGLGSYTALNISCPNTEEGKTFENGKALDELLSAINSTRTLLSYNNPVLIKLSPDLYLESLDELLDVAESYDIDGYIISNTSLKRDGLVSSSRITSKMKGGLSGQPIRKRSTDLIRHVKERLPERIIIGSGGIFSAWDAFEKKRAGASLVQVLTGSIYEGPGLVKKINKGLLNYFT